ncbi:MAG: glycoside hydrolase domain-containing protein [Myxococcales bacterium]
MSKLGIALAAATAIPAAARAEPTVYAESAMVKVKPGAAAKNNAVARIAAARNEWEAFQVVVRADSSPLSGVRATVSDLRGPARSTIPASAVSLYRAELIDITQPSGTIGETGRWPDALVPAVDEIDGEQRKAFPFGVPANESRAIWVDVLVPRDATPGVYRGEVMVEADGFRAEVPVELEVWNFELPSTPTLATAFLIYTGHMCLAHTGSTECGSNLERAELATKYARLALDHRVSLPNIWVLRPNGDDWSQFDEVFGPLLDGTAETRLAGARLTSAQFTWPRTVENYRMFAGHFRDRGWFDRLYDYTADEPGWGNPWSDIPTRAAIIRQADPELPKLVTTSIHGATENGVLDDIDILVPAVNHMENTVEPYAGDQRPKYDDFVASGKRLWMYQSCMSQGCSFGSLQPGFDWPSYMIDVSAARNRLMQWANFKEGVTGELYYETVNAYGKDPWKSQFDFNGNGDGTLFYPGTPAKIGGSSQVPVASIRLKMIREGIEDYEYLALVSKLGDPAMARRTALQVLPTAYAAAGDDPEAIMQARESLAQRILELGGSERTGDSSDIDFFGDGSAPAGGCSAAAGAPLPLLALGVLAFVRRRRT